MLTLYLITCFISFPIISNMTLKSMSYGSPELIDYLCAGTMALCLASFGFLLLPVMILAWLSETISKIVIPR